MVKDCVQSPGNKMLSGVWVMETFGAGGGGGLSLLLWLLPSFVQVLKARHDSKTKRIVAGVFILKSFFIGMDLT